MRCILRILSGLALTALVAGCSSKPDEVIGHDDMVALLVDIHKGEAIADMDRSKFGDESMRVRLKEAIYDRHGVSQEQVDSSLSWYGIHLKEYMEIYDEVDKRIQDEIDASKIKSGKTPVYAEGDSADIWNNQSLYRIDYRVPVKNIAFDFENDPSWKNGDNFTLQFKLQNKRDGGMRIKSSIFVRYDDGEIEYRVSETGSDGWERLKIVTDSLKAVERVYGTLSFDPSPGEIVFLDSLGMVRTRAIPQVYYERGNVRRIHPFKAKAANDSTKNVIDAQLRSAEGLSRI